MFIILAILFLCGMEGSMSCDITVIQECAKHMETLIQNAGKQPTKETVCPVLDAYEKCLVDKAKCGKDEVISGMKIVKDVAAKLNIHCTGKELSPPCHPTVIKECENRYTEILLKNAGKEQTTETVCPVLDAYEKCLVDTAKCEQDRVNFVMKIVKDEMAKVNIHCAGKELSPACHPTVIKECENRYTEILLKNAGKESTKETVCPVLDAYEKCLVDTAKCEKDRVNFVMKIVKDEMAKLNVHCAGANAILSFGLLVFVFILHAVHSKSHSGV